MGCFDFGFAKKCLSISAATGYQRWIKESSSRRDGVFLTVAPLIEKFSVLARNIGERESLGYISSSDVATARGVVGTIKSPGWNPFCIGHSFQVGALARAIGERLDFDPSKLNLIEMAGLLHDIGRFASHDPWIRGMAGMYLLLSLGFGEKIANIAYSHLEAGAPLLGATPENWPAILAADNLRFEIDSLSLPDVIVTVADMAKANNLLCDPMRGVFASVLCRLTLEQQKAVASIDPMAVSQEQLPKLWQVDRKMGMYLGLCWFLRQRLVQEGVVFQGRDGVIASRSGS